MSPAATRRFRVGLIDTSVWEVDVSAPDGETAEAIARERLANNDTSEFSLVSGEVDVELVEEVRR